MLFTHQRKAFSMLTAIALILIMATVSMYVLNTSSKIVVETTAQYQREQAALLAKSYTEYAILAVTSNENNTSNCLRDIDGTMGNPNEGAGYRIRTRIAYIGHADKIGTVGTSIMCANTRILANNNTEESPVNILIDTYIEYKEADHPDPASAPFITYHKRTLQKI